jgi:hypothetical protein
VARSAGILLRYIERDPGAGRKDVNVPSFMRCSRSLIAFPFHPSPRFPPEILLTLPVQDLEISIGALYPAALSF